MGGPVVDKRSRAVPSPRTTRLYGQVPAHATPCRIAAPTGRRGSGAGAVRHGAGKVSGEIVALEAPPDVIRGRNRSRPAPVPDTVIDRLIDKWESPDLTEAH